jgi:stress response protein YsnF
MMSGRESSGQGDGAPRQRAAWIDSDSAPGEVRIGEARLVKGGAKVSAFTEEAPAAEDVSRDRGRVLSDSQVAEGGLLRERVIEMSEEAVVTKQAVVREELVIRRDVEERTERIADTVRRTEVDVERLGSDEAVESEGAEDAAGR